MPRFNQRAGREVMNGHPRLPEWITRERVRLADLHAMKAGLRSADQAQMPGVQVAHRRHEPDAHPTKR